MPAADIPNTSASLFICMLYISKRLYLCFVLYGHETRAELLCCELVTMMKCYEINIVPDAPLLCFTTS